MAEINFGNNGVLKISMQIYYCFQQVYNVFRQKETCPEVSKWHHYKFARGYI